MKEAEHEAQTPLDWPQLVCWWAAGFHWKQMTARDHLAFTSKSLPAHLDTFPADAAVIFNAKPHWMKHWFLFIYLFILKRDSNTAGLTHVFFLD